MFTQFTCTTAWAVLLYGAFWCSINTLNAAVFITSTRQLAAVHCSGSHRSWRKSTAASHSHCSRRQLGVTAHRSGQLEHLFTYVASSPTQKHTCIHVPRAQCVKCLLRFYSVEYSRL